MVAFSTISVLAQQKRDDLGLARSYGTIAMPDFDSFKTQMVR